MAGRMSIEVMRQALEALAGVADWVNIRTREHPWDQWQRVEPAMNTLRTAIAEAEKQEPVADGLIRGYVNALVANRPDEAADATKRMVDYVFTTPPAAQRQWVGLTDDEIDAIFEQHHNQYGECESPNFGYERAIEAKLKEKNT